DAVTCGWPIHCGIFAPGNSCHGCFSSSGAAKTVRACIFKCSGLCRRIVGPPIRQSVEARQLLIASKAGERDFLFLPRLEAHGSAGSDIEPHSERLLPVEIERLVDFEEVVVGADL